jgi:translation initiation factor IF-3
VIKKREPARARVNEQITSYELRVIASNGDQLGVLQLREALRLAEEEAMDLVEISPTAKPPVCRIMNYGKYLFELNKKQAAAKKKQKLVQVKEVKFRPTTDDGDYQVKLRNLIRFLEHGDKVKITVRFRGRELSHQELGVALLDRLKIDTQEHGVIEQEAKREGKQLGMVIGPKKK